MCILIPLVQPLVRSHFQVKLHPEASICPEPAVAHRADLSQESPESPLAAPMHWTTTQSNVSQTFVSLESAVVVSVEGHTGHSPSLSASPLWGPEPKSETPPSTEAIWSHRRPSKR